MSSVLKAIVAVALVLSTVLLIVGCGNPSSFNACETARIESVDVSDGEVRIKGGDSSPFPKGFVGYYAEEKDGTLYVGFKLGGILGVFETADFDITIPVEGDITEVVMKSGDSEYQIWPDTDSTEDKPD